MLIDGEKYACEACVRGHRVSNCNHYERPLSHINKKGRPVSQCPHCRGLRKARSSHVKCECGEKPHTKTDCPSPDKLSVKAGQKNCCCSHGSKCTCALKRDHLSKMQGQNTSGLTRSRSHTDTNKPALNLYHTENPMTVFHNGHHKPVHHRNFAGHECGLPYKIPRPHSIHGSNGLAQSSTDSLPLLSGPFDLMVDDRMARSEHGSPALPPKVDLLNQLPQLDLTYGALNTDIASSVSSPMLDDFSQGPASGGLRSYFSGTEDGNPMSAMGTTPVDWAAMDLPLDTGSLPVDYNQARSYTSFEQGPTSNPGLNAPASDVSDTEDYIGRMQSPGIYCGSPFPSAMENNVMGTYNMSSESLVLPTTSATSMPMNSALEQYVTSGMTATNDFPDYHSNASPEPEDFHPRQMVFSEMQKLSHPGLGIDTGRGPSPPSFRPTSDPSWAGAAAFAPEESSFMPTSAPFRQQQAPWTSC